MCGVGTISQGPLLVDVIIVQVMKNMSKRMLWTIRIYLYV